LSRRRVFLGASAPAPSAVRVASGASATSAHDAVVERLRDEARAEGVVAGIALANQQAAQALSAAAAALDARCAEVVESVAATAVELAVEIARHLVRAEVDAGRHDVERIVRETLAAGATGRAECVVHVHPDDAAALAGVPFRSGTRIEPDVGVGRGEVQVVTPNGLLVRDLDEAFDEIRRRMRAQIGADGAVGR
jgi:type III secretion protein L